MGQAGAEIIALVVDEYLCLVFQAAEGGGVQDPVTVALEGGAVFGLVIEVGPALEILLRGSVRSQAAVFDFLNTGGYTYLFSQIYPKTEFNPCPEGMSTMQECAGDFIRQCMAPS